MPQVGKAMMRLKKVLICIVLAHVLAIAALAASSQLHERLHSDAKHQGHDCAITLFASGACDSANGAPINVERIGFALSDAQPPAGDRVRSCYLACRILEHAPPAHS